ncbi:MmpS family transport accessory protein [Tsukamurella pseudospumae]|uniref:MmpS family membrane protein n=1 Tax=Tsukamurella pseudospumae TaxID=239498 RepID=A0A137ZRU2_9ACTN|nr:MmpS family transport accessory protein [Tsukamurella pseudospumae]KXP00922.1 hypothetical protein AXK61_13010 [Tsukamurella pseudospumae]
MTQPPVPPQQPYPGQQPPYPPQQPPKKRKKWPWVLLGIFILIVALAGGCMAMIGGAAKSISDESNKTVDVTYKVTGPATGALITYTINDNITQDTGVKLPWEKQTQVTGFVKTVTLSATNGMYDNGKITCQVIVGGKVIIENTASGTGASASCSGSVDTKK